MATRNLIQLTEICSHCGVDVSFVHSLQELGHIEVVVQDEQQFIDEVQLKMLEQMIFFHRELHINVEGIDAIAHLLNRIETLQRELLAARNKLDALSLDRV